MIELKNISKRFHKPGEGHIEVLKNVDFKINEGDFIAIVGPSGSGKSTLLNILGLLSKPDTGDYLFDNKNTSTLSMNELAELRNQVIGFVFQQFHLLDRTTAKENVQLPLLYGLISDIEKPAIAALEKVGLLNRLNHTPAELSGGQQQRVAIARAIVTKPKIILADEPTGNLDSASIEQVMGLLKQLNQEGTTVLFITHDEQLAGLADRIVLIENGLLNEANMELQGAAS
ncbi:MAG: ABC transporter ATP-binding protein [Marinicella sp.]